MLYSFNAEPEQASARSISTTESWLVMDKLPSNAFEILSPLLSDNMFSNYVFTRNSSQLVNNLPACMHSFPLGASFQVHKHENKIKHYSEVIVGMQWYIFGLKSHVFQMPSLIDTL